MTASMPPGWRLFRAPVSRYLPATLALNACGGWGLYRGLFTRLSRPLVFADCRTHLKTVFLPSSGVRLIRPIPGLTPWERLRRPIPLPCGIVVPCEAHVCLDILRSARHSPSLAENINPDFGMGSDPHVRAGASFAHGVAASRFLPPAAPWRRTESVLLTIPSGPLFPPQPGEPFSKEEPARFCVIGCEPTVRRVPPFFFPEVFSCVLYVKPRQARLCFFFCAFRPLPRNCPSSG